MSLLLAHDIEVPKEHWYWLWHSPKQCEFGSSKGKKKKKKVKMNRVFGSPYKFSLYSHYTHFSQQYSISLSMSCTLCVLTQILRELKAGQYHPSKWDSRWNSSTHPTTAKFHSFCFSCEFVIYKSHTPYSDTVAPDSTESITMSPLAKICCIPSQ